MRRALLLIFFFTLLLAGALANTVCIRGSANLVQTADAPTTDYCNATNCQIEYEMSFDAANTAAQRWPLTVRLSDGTYLSSRFPELADVAFQCNAGGDIILNTRIASGMQHMRFIWTYVGASSFDCNYVLSTINWQTDFSIFQVLLAYSGSSIATFDAVFSSYDANAYSLPAQAITCPTVDSTSGSSGSGGSTTASSTTTTTASSTTTSSSSSSGTVGACRYPGSVWLHARKHSAEWLTVADLEICTASYADIATGHGNAAALPPGILALAQQVVFATLNAAMYGVSAANVAELSAALDIVDQSINCASTDTFDSLVAPLADWNNQTATCVSDNKVVANSKLSECQKLRDKYLAWAIAMTVVAGVLMLIILLAIAYLIYRHIQRDRQMGNQYAQTPGGGDALIGQEQPSWWSLSATPDEPQLVPVTELRPKPHHINLGDMYLPDN